MHKKIIQWAMLGVLPFFIGCIDTNDQFTINPDGSGKVVHESRLITYYSHGVLASVLNKQPTADELKACVKNIMENSKGVDAWRDLSYKVQDDGKIYFKATAYFPDIRQLKIDNQGTSTSMNGISFQNDSSHITIELADQTSKKVTAPQAPAMPVPQTQEEIDKAVARQLQQYKQMRGVMQSVLADMKVTDTFILPGQIETMTNFQKNPDGSISIQWDGSKILANMDRLGNDPAYITEKIKEGKNAFDQNSMNGDESNKMLFGQEGPVKVDLAGPFKPLFDYGSEVQEAKKEYEKILESLNTGSAKTPVNPVAAPAPQTPVPVKAEGTSNNPQAALSLKADESDDSCGSMQGQSSKESLVPVQLIIQNHSNVPLSLWWITFKGESKKYAEIPASGVHTQKSFSTHVWEIENQTSNNCVGEFQLGPSDKHIDVF